MLVAQGCTKDHFESVSGWFIGFKPGLLVFNGGSMDQQKVEFYTKNSLFLNKNSIFQGKTGIFSVFWRKIDFLFWFKPLAFLKIVGSNQKTNEPIRQSRAALTSSKKKKEESQL